MNQKDFFNNQEKHKEAWDQPRNVIEEISKQIKEKIKNAYINEKNKKDGL